MCDRGIAKYSFMLVYCPDKYKLKEFVMRLLMTV